MFVLRKLKDISSWFRYILPQGLQNLFIYGSIIWNTREWDYAYLYELIIFKLKRMENNLRHGVAFDRRITAHRIKCAYEALERVNKDEYPGFKEFCKLSKVKRKFFPRWKFINDERLKNKDLKLFTDYFYKYSGTWWD